MLPHGTCLGPSSSPPSHGSCSSTFPRLPGHLTERGTCFSVPSGVPATALARTCCLSLQDLDHHRPTPGRAGLLMSATHPRCRSLLLFPFPLACEPCEPCSVCTDAYEGEKKFAILPPIPLQPQRWGLSDVIRCSDLPSKPVLWWERGVSLAPEALEASLPRAQGLHVCSTRSISESLNLLHLLKSVNKPFACFSWDLCYKEGDPFTPGTQPVPEPGCRKCIKTLNDKGSREGGIPSGTDGAGWWVLPTFICNSGLKTPGLPSVQMSFFLINIPSLGRAQWFSQPGFPPGQLDVSAVSRQFISFKR